MSPFRARALEKDFPYGVQPRQRRPGLKNPKRQMPSCRTQLAIFPAPSGRRRPVWPPRPNPQSYTARTRRRAPNSQSCAPPGGAGAPCGLRVPTRKVTRPGSRARPQLANLRAPRGACVPCGLRAPTRKVTRPGLAGAPSTRKVTRLGSRARPQLANLRAPRGAGAPCGLRAPTRKVTSASQPFCPKSRRGCVVPAWGIAPGTRRESQDAQPVREKSLLPGVRAWGGRKSILLRSWLTSMPALVIFYHLSRFSSE